MLPIRIWFRYWWRSLVDRVWALYHWYTYRPGDKNILVVGGSWGGYTLARRLANGVPSGYRVVVVERATHHHHTFAFPRYSVVGGHEEKGFIPIGEQKPGQWPRGALEVLVGECVSVDEDSRNISLADGRTLDYEFLAIATGANVGEPANSQDGFAKDAAMNELKRNQKRIEASGTVAVIGAGAVGVELAADIKSVYPHKHVTLFCSRDRVLVRFPESVHEQASAELEKLGVDVRYRTRPGREGNTIVLDDGRREDFDLVFKCTGEVPNSQGFEQFCDSRGYIKVTDTLQVQDNNPDGRIFCVGDVNNFDCPKMARSAMAQARVADANISTMAAAPGQKSYKLSTYTPAEVEGALRLTLGLDKNILHLDGKTTDFPACAVDMEPHYIWDYFNVQRNFGPGVMPQDVSCDKKEN